MKKPPKANLMMKTLNEKTNIKPCLNFTIELVEEEMVK